MVRVFLSSGKIEGKDPQGESLHEKLYQTYKLQVQPQICNLLADGKK